MNLKHKDLETFFDDAFGIVKKKIQNLLKNKNIGLKLNVILNGGYIIPSVGDEDMKYFATKNHIILRTTDLNEIFQLLKEQLYNKVC